MAQSPQSPNVFLAVFLRFHWCQIRGEKSHRIRPKKARRRDEDSFFSLISLDMQTRNHFGTLLLKATTHANKLCSHCAKEGASAKALSQRKVCFSTVTSPALLTWLLCSAAAGVRAPAPLRHSGPESHKKKRRISAPPPWSVHLSPPPPLSMCCKPRPSYSTTTFILPTIRPVTEEEEEEEEGGGDANLLLAISARTIHPLRLEDEGGREVLKFGELGEGGREGDIRTAVPVPYASPLPISNGDTGGGQRGKR